MPMPPFGGSGGARNDFLVRLSVTRDCHRCPSSRIREDVRVHWAYLARMDSAHKYTVSAFDSKRCAEFLSGTAGAPPRRELLMGIAHAESVAPRRALDIGCGPGKEIVALLQAGFDVVAFDPYQDMLDRARSTVDCAFDGQRPALELHLATLEDFAQRIEPHGFGLVHAGFVLPFVLPQSFPEVFARLLAGIAPGGVLVAQFFGPDDEFVRNAAPNTMTSQGEEEVSRLLSGLDILHREEVNRAGAVGRGVNKWWHVHHVIARMR